eukprot:scaffold93675_cov54-Phaeocystis_antarctica.AAC.2
MSAASGWNRRLAGRWTSPVPPELRTHGRAMVFGATRRLREMLQTGVAGARKGDTGASAKVGSEARAKGLLPLAFRARV